MIFFYFFIHLWSVSAFNVNRLIRSLSSLPSGITKILFLRSRPNANSTAHIRKVLQLCSTQPIQTLQTTWRELKAKQLITQWIWLEICQIRRLQSVSCCTVRPTRPLVPQQRRHSALCVSSSCCLFTDQWHNQSYWCAWCDTLLLPSCHWNWGLHARQTEKWMWR